MDGDTPEKLSVEELTYRLYELACNDFQETDPTTGEAFDKEGRIIVEASIRLLELCKSINAQEENKRLRDALEPFAKFITGVSAKDEAPAAYGVFHSNNKPLLVGEFRRARAALQENVK